MLFFFLAENFVDVFLPTHIYIYVLEIGNGIHTIYILLNVKMLHIYHYLGGIKLGVTIAMLLSNV